MSIRRTLNTSSSLAVSEKVFDGDSTPNLTDSEDDYLSDGTIDRELMAKDLPKVTKFDFVLLDVFTRTPGKGRRIAIIVLDGETGQFLLPFERKMLVTQYDCPAMVLYSRSDGKSQFYIEHQCKNDMKTDWEPFETSHGVLALNYLLDLTDAQFNDRKEGQFIRTFLDGAEDFAGINYHKQHYVHLEERSEDDWFEIMPFRAGCDTALEDRTMQYRTVNLPPTIIDKAGFAGEIIKDISKAPVFVHQFGAIGFTFVNLYTTYNFNHITTGIPDFLVKEILAKSSSRHEDAFIGNNAGTVFFHISPRLCVETCQNKHNFEVYDLYQIYAKIVAPFPDSPATGSAATTLAAYLALYLSDYDIRYRESHERELDIGDHRITRFMMHLDTANTSKNQGSRVEIVVETEVDSLLRTKISELRFGAPIALVQQKSMETVRECLNVKSNIWHAAIRPLEANNEASDEGSDQTKDKRKDEEPASRGEAIAVEEKFPSLDDVKVEDISKGKMEDERSASEGKAMVVEEKFPSLDDVKIEVEDIAKEKRENERSASINDAMAEKGKSPSLDDAITGVLSGEGLGCLLPLSKKERKYLARLFKEGLEP
ncbi:hypothetical protein SBOR_6980 [Sclerotinia borealis F-4128]|uniref:Uncharacterized protein n=1 Tax=Sclerotinia borealis (strain F-4128) TaxID=1432307 RepID=W9C9W1_SCLBF|nr:hypothetical protein SBOR_6980 [Sclerotinia borealis F-4128]